MYRQGDILLTPVASRAGDWQHPVMRGAGNRPGHVKIVKKNRRVNDGIVVAAGEATGHHHRVRTPRARMIKRGQREFLLVPKGGAELTHEEHDTINLPAGTYEITRQREYTPNPIRERAWTRVVD